VSKIAINADDFGRDAGHNAAVLDAFKAGSLSCASIMVVAPGFEEAVEMTLKHNLRVGLHLCLTCDAALKDDYRPLSGHRCLTLNGDGKRFPNVTFKLLKEYLPQIQEECMMQYEKLRATGIRPTHVDTHMHCVPLYDSSLATALDHVYDKYKIRFIDYRKGKISDKVEQRRIIGWKSIGGNGLDGKMKRLERMVSIIAKSSPKFVWVHSHMDKSSDPGNPRREEYELMVGGAVDKLLKKYSVEMWYPGRNS